MYRYTLRDLQKTTRTTKSTRRTWIHSNSVAGVLINHRLILLQCPHSRTPPVCEQLAVFHEMLAKQGNVDIEAGETSAPSFGAIEPMPVVVSQTPAQSDALVAQRA